MQARQEKAPCSSRSRSLTLSPAKRLKDDLRHDPRIYTRTKKANGQSNVGKQFRLTRVTVNGKPL